jgi:NAD(P)-dependent dehydrogenase (short-subunit alcohol dehydrogenase family)
VTDGSSLFGLAGRTVLVAGAGGGGIGTAVCGLLASLGADIVGLDNRVDALKPLQQALEGTAGRHAAIVADVRDRDQVETALEEALAASGSNLLGGVHVAGGMRPAQWAPLLDEDEAAYDSNFDEVMRLNLTAALITCRTVARQLVSQGAGGSIVAISSVAGLTATPFASAYAASKAALISLTRTAALEWGGAGIRVNAVAPGTIRTPKTIATAAGKALSQDVERAAIPLGHRGGPADIAGAVAFLLSDLAQWITGQVLAVDGGSSALPSFLDADRLPVFVTNADLRERLTGKARP